MIGSASEKDSGQGQRTTPLHDLATARRLVVKIGSALLVEEQEGEVRRLWLDALVDDVANLVARGQEVVIVSSGAIAIGRRQLKMTRPTIRLEEKQAAAAAGQIRLAHAYQESFARHNLDVAQILLTFADTEERRRHLNARSTLNTLLRLKTVPVINENDTVATSEIRVGDNDRLAARVAAMLAADTLLLLSDIDGLYTADPRKESAAEFVPSVNRITPAIEAMAGAAPVGYSSGGMRTKLAAGKIAQSAGCRMVIGDGRRLNPLRAIEEGARCTWFMAELEPRTARKQWIAGSLKPAGQLTLDAGALKALQNGKSLLPAGVTGVAGGFERGDAVQVLDPAGSEVARGLAAYSAADARKIIGHNSRKIEAILGYRGREELIHRDDLVLI
ncbi:MAG: glutamate 5-kinase [Pseudomonadota bacterium]